MAHHTQEKKFEKDITIVKRKAAQNLIKAENIRMRRRLSKIPEVVEMSTINDKTALEASGSDSSASENGLQSLSLV